jgi:hypothetical protein
MATKYPDTPPSIGVEKVSGVVFYSRLGEIAVPNV